MLVKNLSLFRCSAYLHSFCDVNSSVDPYTKKLSALAIVDKHQPVMDVRLVFFVFQSIEPSFQINIRHFVTKKRSIHHRNIAAVPDNNTKKISEIAISNVTDNNDAMIFKLFNCYYFVLCAIFIFYDCYLYLIRHIILRIFFHQEMYF